jgi:hypothetical protein
VPVTRSADVVAALPMSHTAVDIVVLLIITIVSANFAFHFLFSFLG